VQAASCAQPNAWSLARAAWRAQHGTGIFMQAAWYRQFGMGHLVFVALCKSLSHTLKYRI